MRITCIERVLIAAPSLAESRTRWARAGFAIAPKEIELEGVRFAQLAAGAIEIDLCTLVGVGAAAPLAAAVAEPASRGGGIIGWTWGIDRRERQPDPPIRLPGAETPASALSQGLTGVFTAALELTADPNARCQLHRETCGDNPNTVEFLEHIVVMAPVLEDAIATQEALGIPCKRIREVGNGTRQAFFKLERTVIEVVGPSRERAGCWGLAFMCSDIARAVAVARDNGLAATEPRPAVQGGLIARIVDPIDGVSIAFMQAP
jgi:predicted enzyme related to lactoylglutathione lyase